MGCMAALGTGHAPAADPETAFADLETRSGGRLGVTCIDLETSRTLVHRADERFAMCSTFKLPLVAAVLAKVDRGGESLGRLVPYTPNDLLDYAPATRQHVTQGAMTVEALCAAAITLSDNTAANLLLATVGGPPAVTQFARDLGDGVTRLDRNEPALNSGLPGDPRDTTSPRAMAQDLQKLIAGNALSASSAAKLTRWLIDCQTGTTCLRAGLPSRWRVGDKTGTGGPINAKGDSTIRNDVAVIWPPGKKPLIVAAYLSHSQLAATDRDAILAQVARVIAEWT